MMVYPHTDRRYRYYLWVYLVLWIILFEFILPVNRILPKPSIVLETFPALWKEYALAGNIISTVAVVYLSMGAAYFLLKGIRGALLREGHKLNPFLHSLEWFSKYVPGIIIALFLMLWFPNSEYIEFIFAFATVFAGLLIRTIKLRGTVPADYIDAARSLGMPEKEISRNIEWKFMQPSLFTYLIELHFYVWMLLLIFEFIKGGLGIGAVYSDLLRFNDLAGIFSLSVITGAIIFTGRSLLKYINGRFYNW